LSEFEIGVRTLLPFPAICSPRDIRPLDIRPTFSTVAVVYRGRNYYCGFLQMIDSSGADMLRKLVPGCRRVDVVDKCGHAIALDQPKQVADLLLDFHRTSALTI